MEVIEIDVRVLLKLVLLSWSEITEVVVSFSQNQDNERNIDKVDRYGFLYVRVDWPVEYNRYEFTSELFDLIGRTTEFWFH